LSIIGSTGSGKTVAALWHLSNRDFDKMPWIVYDFKREPTISGIPGIRPISLTEIPTKPGLYTVTPHPHQDEEVEHQMWHVWRRGNTGIYVDEGYMIGANNRAFRTLLTQGRSLRIPIIVLSQRPVWMDRFVFSESQFFQIFRLQHKGDIRNVQEFVPAPLDKRLPEYHSYYYDVGENKVDVLRPVPDLDTIYGTIETRLRPLRKVI